MKKLFENWRGYLNEKRKLEEPVSPRDDKRVLKLINLAEQARATFIKNIFYNNRKSLAKKIAKKLSEIENVSTLPTANKFINEVVDFLKSTDIKFTNKKNSSSDPDYGGPAFYLAGDNLIVVEEIQYWFAESGTEWYTRMIWHELGHAMDRAISVSLRRAADETIWGTALRRSNFTVLYYVDALKDFFQNEVVVPQMVGPIGNVALKPLENRFAKSEKKDIKRIEAGPGEEWWYSKPKWKRLLSITKKSLSPGRTKVHKEDVVEFYASLKELNVILGREITPIDVQIMRAADWIDFEELVYVGDIDDKAWINSIKHFKDFHGKSLREINNEAERVRTKKFWETGPYGRVAKVVQRLIRSETSRMIDDSVSPIKVAQVLNELL